MFEFANPVTFKYFVPFLVFYILLLVFYFGSKVYVKRQEKDKRRILRKSFGYFFESCFWVGLLGLIYLGARRYNVYFLSMEFLHVLNGLLLVTFLWAGMKKYRSIMDKS